MNKRLVMFAYSSSRARRLRPSTERGRRRKTVSDGEIDERSTTGYTASHA
jgi:hypothetical protein